MLDKIKTTRNLLRQALKEADSFADWPFQTSVDTQKAQAEERVAILTESLNSLLNQYKSA